MRLPDDRLAKYPALLLSLALAGCGATTAGERPAAVAHVKGPAADYPMVLGAPYTIDGVEYAPADVWNVDEVGYAVADATEEAGPGVTAAHRTLPLPSYVEVTSLDTGRTIVVRVERRGPMAGAGLVSLSPAALTQLGGSDGVPVRVRRVNPPEPERALLRAGLATPERLDTPQALVAILRRKLPSVETIAKSSPAEPPEFQSAAEPAADHALVGAVQAPAAPPGIEEAEPALAVTGHLVVQAATFASEANARKAAEALEGFVVPTGRFFRVRTGPYSSRGQADAALAKVKAAGYSDARVIDAG